jgi:cell division protein FtsW
MGAPLRHLRAVAKPEYANPPAPHQATHPAPRQGLFLAATLVVVALLCGLQAFSLWRAPAAWMPAAITLRLAPGESIVLGRHELAAPQADKVHLSLRREASGAAGTNGGWTLRNLSASRQVVLQRDGGDQRMGSAALQGGQRVQVGAAVFEVLGHGGSGGSGSGSSSSSSSSSSTGTGTGSGTGGSVTLARDGHQWRYDGAVLYRDGVQQNACPDTHIATRALAVWNRWAPSLLSVARPMSFGGNLQCDNRLGLEAVTPGSAQIARSNGQLQLFAASPDGERAAVLLYPAQNGSSAASAADRIDLRRQEASLDGVSAIIVGHTRYQLDATATATALTLTPSRHIALFSAPETRLPPQIDWQWRQRELWHNTTSAGWLSISIAVALAATLALAALRLATTGAGSATPRPSVRRSLPPSLRAAREGSNATTSALPRPGPLGLASLTRGTGYSAIAASISVLLCGLAALAAQRLGYTPSAASSMALATIALLLWITLPGRLSLLTAAAAILLAIGLLSQLELGLAAPESSWLRYYQKSAALLAIGTGAGGLLPLWFRHHTQRRVHLSQRSIEWLLALLAAVALAALAAQVLWGDETGVFDLQPVELAKLALTALTAHCLALRFGWSSSGGPQTLSSHGARWLQLIAPALLFLALLGLALVQVDDFSPLILLLVWSTAMAMAYAIAARNRLLAAALVCLVLAVVGAVAWLRLSGSDDLIRWGFYADRFLVWLNPSEHPHTGQQLLLGAHAIAEGGWWGADHWMGLRSLGQAAGSVVQIPAVQDDFAASFFLNRHGLAGALMLWAVQAALLAGLVQIAARCHAAGAAARDFRHAWSGRFRYFALCGGAAFVLGHLLLSWGTNLAIFPIMGQPMSFLSAGGSHLLFFLCPLLAFGAVSAHTFEENESCRSMSNMKS